MEDTIRLIGSRILQFFYLPERHYVPRENLLICSALAVDIVIQKSRFFLLFFLSDTRDVRISSKTDEKKGRFGFIITKSFGQSNIPLKMVLSPRLRVFSSFTVSVPHCDFMENPWIIQILGFDESAGSHCLKRYNCYQGFPPSAQYFVRLIWISSQTSIKFLREPFQSPRTTNGKKNLFASSKTLFIFHSIANWSKRVSRNCVHETDKKKYSTFRLQKYITNI